MRPFAALLILAAVLPAPARAATEIKAVNGATVQPGGPRPGAQGKLYLNVEGKNNGEDGKYASFGVLDFQPTKPGQPITAVKTLTLKMVQSPVRFSKDGKFRVFLASNANAKLDALKFDAKASGGVGSQLETLLPLGSATYKKGESGAVETIELSPSGKSADNLRDLINAGGVIRIVLAPDDDDVAATYYGVDPEKPEHRPTLVVDSGS